MRIFWKISILQMAENENFYVKRNADDHGEMEKWL